MRKQAVQLVRTKAGRPAWGRILLLVLAVLLLLFLLLWLLAPGLASPARLVRFFRYMGLRDKEGYGVISYDGGAGAVYADLEGSLLVGTENGLTLYAMDGEQKALIQGSLPTPVLRTGGGRSLCFSPGSSYAAAVDSSGAVLLDEAFDGAFVDANVSFDGCIAYLSTENGYKTVATVLNREQKPIYRYYSRTRYLNACAVSEDGALLAVASLEEQDSLFRSGVTFFRTDEEMADRETEQGSSVSQDLGSGLIYELCFLDGDDLLAVCQNQLVFLRTDGSRLYKMPLNDESLLDYSVSEDGWVILALRTDAGGDRVLTLDAEGELLGELKPEGRVRSVSAAESCAAVLTERSVGTYDRRLHARDSSPDTAGATRALARSDGTVLLICAGTTKLLIP